jgi:quercetin dioxygenase-like cupin family protein
MSKEPIPSIPIIDESALEWRDHPRFSGIRMKQMLTAAANPQASVSRVQVPPGGVIGWHNHSQQMETVYVLAGRSVLTLGEIEMPFAAGRIVAIPSGLEHTLRNAGLDVVELLCFFTPPLA